MITTEQSTRTLILTKLKVYYEFMKGRLGNRNSILRNSRECHEDGRTSSGNVTYLNRRRLRGRYKTVENIVNWIIIILVTISENINVKKKLGHLEEVVS